jgi:SAM-dependent methyltransferase
VNSEYWENRYLTRDMPWEKGEASPGLVDFLAVNPALPRGTVCVPGCGTGHDARAFARAGFATFGFDFAPSAVKSAREQSAGLPILYTQADFLHDTPPQKFDWLFEHTLFCAIQPEQREEYVRAVLCWLKPDGQYLAVNYIECGPDGPPFPTTREEQLERFSPHFDLVADWVPRSYSNREGRERMFWWRRKAI